MSYLTDEITRRGQDTCSLCPNLKLARGWCRKHYNRWYAHGDPTVQLRPSNAEFQAATAAEWADDGFWEQVTHCTRVRLALPRVGA